MKKADIETFFARLAALNPNPKCELNYTNPYTLMVAIILSAQATDKGVNKATPALFAIADAPGKMLALGEAGLKEYIKTIGLFNNKAKNIIAMSKELVSTFGGKLPKDRSKLEALSGVGRKSANVFLNVIYNEPFIAVDTHVFRVSNRTKLATGKTPLEVENELEKVVPNKYKNNASHWLVLHGRYTCTAKNPKCATCPVADLCPYSLTLKSALE
jgi:endonuclease-3